MEQNQTATRSHGGRCSDGLGCQATYRKFEYHTINTGDSADRRTEGSHQRMVRIDCDTGKIPEVPQDDYMPVWNYEPVRESAGDSMAMGHWVWRKVFVGYVGAITGVMLGPEWADILEVI